MGLFGGGKIQWPSGQRPDNDPRWAEPIFPPVKWVNGHPQTEPAMVGGPRMVGGNPKAAPRMVGGNPKAAPRMIGGIPQAAERAAPAMVGGIAQAAPRMVGGIEQAAESQEGDMKKGGRVKSSASSRADGIAQRGKTRGSMPTMKKGGSVSSASSRADGIAQRGKTKGRIV